MLRPRGPCGLEDKSFVLGFSLTLSGLGLMVIGLVASNIYSAHGKDKVVFPYSLPSVGPSADPGVQAVSPQVT